jgi:hypothetical protein
MLNQQIELIAKAFESRDRLPMHLAERALKLLDKAPKEALELIVARKIKFLWMPAKRRLQEMK